MKSAGTLKKTRKPERRSQRPRDPGHRIIAVQHQPSTRDQSSPACREDPGQPGSNDPENDQRQHTLPQQRHSDTQPNGLASTFSLVSITGQKSFDEPPICITSPSRTGIMEKAKIHNLIRSWISRVEQVSVLPAISETAVCSRCEGLFFTVVRSFLACATAIWVRTSFRSFPPSSPSPHPESCWREWRTRCFALPARWPCSCR